MASHVRQNLFLNVGNNAVSETCILTTTSDENVLKSDPADYEVIVEKFSISAMDLPLSIIPIKTPTNINETIYSVSIGVGNATPTTRFITWSPQTNITPPSSSLLSQDTSSSYYHLYSYEHFVGLVNIALRECMDVASSANAETKTPFMEYDASTGMFVLNGDKTLFGPAGTLRLYGNNAFYQLFPNFNVDLTTFGYRYKFIEIPSGFNLDTANNRIMMSQEIRNLNNWSAVDSFVLKSNLPVNSESYKGVNFGLSTKTATITNIPLATIGDMQVFGNEFRNGYVAIPDYRPISMNGSQKFKTINVEVYWRDKFGNLRVLNLPCGASCSLRLLFRKRI